MPKIMTLMPTGSHLLLVDVSTSNIAGYPRRWTVTSILSAGGNKREQE
jgi:hypothetical protein